MFFRRFACVKQNDQSDCGPACLAAISLHYGRPVRLQQMRDLAGTDRIGTNLLGMVQAAERMGFMAKAVKGNFDVLPKAPLPAIAHVRTKEGLGHFVVLHQVKKNAVVIADPARGIVKQSAAEFKTMWTGYLILLAPEQTGPRRIGSEPLSPGRRLPGPAHRPRGAGSRGHFLRHPDDDTGRFDLVFRAASRRFGAGPRRGAVAQRSRYRHGAGRRLPHPLQHVAADSADPHRPQGGPRPRFRLHAAHPGPADELL